MSTLLVIVWVASLLAVIFTFRARSWAWVLVAVGAALLATVFAAMTDALTGMVDWVSNHLLGIGLVGLLMILLGVALGVLVPRRSGAAKPRRGSDRASSGPTV